MAEMPGWEESEQGSSKETLPIVTSSALASGAEQQGCQGLGALRGTFGAFISMARTLEPTYQQCHINVVPLMYVNEASDRLPQEVKSELLFMQRAHRTPSTAFLVL